MMHLERIYLAEGLVWGCALWRGGEMVVVGDEEERAAGRPFYVFVGDG